jgi:transposase
MSGSLGGALVAVDGQASEALLAAVLEENRQLREDNARLLASEARLLEENRLLREQQAQQVLELEQLRADLAVLQRLLFGRSSERSRTQASGSEAADSAGGGVQAGSGRDGGGNDGGQQKPKRGPGARSGRRDYSRLPRFEVFWDFPDGGVLLPAVRAGVHRPG